MQLRRTGLDIQHVRRANRTGYKAGALAYGMTQTDADFFAVFDADFVPPPDFLQRTIPYFVTTPALGIVQTRWGHTNANANWLTQAQSLAIDAHFVVEQTARNRAACCSRSTALAGYGGGSVLTMLAAGRRIR
jgi:cellulose synthase/poly-beta-1,6-N-acetylglucosamine synthase-like glycosyltransferase